MKFQVCLLVLCTFLLGGCFEYDDIVYQGVDNIKIGKPSNGKTAIGFDIKLENPNRYKIKIKPSDLTVFIGGKELGEIHLKETLVIDKRTMKIYPLSIDASLKDIAKAGLGSLIEIATKKTLTLSLKGYIKGSVYGVTQKRFIDQTKEIETKHFLQLFNL